jgi:hypothetical protein
MKDIVAVVGNYTDRNGNEKAEFLKIGAIGVSQQGKEYLILDPGVSISGALYKQNLNNQAKGKPAQKSLMCSVFDKNQQQKPVQQHPMNQSMQQIQQTMQQQQQAPVQDMNDDIPF